VKQLILMTVLILVIAVAAVAYTPDDYVRGRTYFGSGNKTLDPMYLHMQDAANGFGRLGTGSVFYVDSNVTNEGDGTSWTRAKDTLDEAIALCVSARGDIIYIAQGHQEVEAAAGNIFEIDVAGVTVVGISNGGMSGPVATGAATLNLMPIFILDHADATATMSAPNCRITGCRFESDVIDNAIGLTISAAADGFVVDNCIFRDGAAAEEMVIGINVAADSDNGKLINNTFSTVASGGCASAITLAGGSDNTVISGNVAYGTYSVAALDASTAASLNTIIQNNVFCNEGAAAVELHGSTTGILTENYIGGTTSLAAALTGDTAIFCFENYCNGNVGESGTLSPAVE
jgi:hypothetical protein